MGDHLSRRTAIGLGAAAATLVATGRAAVAAPSGSVEPAAPAGIAANRNKIRRGYAEQKARAGGVCHSHIAMVNPAGVLETIVDDDADRVTHGYSVQKLAVAVAVLDKIDRGELQLDQRLDLSADIILGGSGSST